MTDENNYWFPRKRYGWGWGVPTKWQGWAVLLGYIVGMVLLALVFPPDQKIAAYLVSVAALTGVLIWICSVKGEPPGGWHWGD